MTLDLDPIRQFVEDELMHDTDVLITRDEDRESDDVWDPETMTYTQPEGDAEVVYEGGCWISSVSIPVQEEQGSQEVTETWYVLNLPMGTPEVKLNDLVTCTRNDRDPAMADWNFLVLDEMKGTFKVKRAIRMQRVKLAVR